jgi:hypothetical protein
MVRKKALLPRRHRANWNLVSVGSFDIISRRRLNFLCHYLLVNDPTLDLLWGTQGVYTRLLHLPVNYRRILGFDLHHQVSSASFSRKSTDLRGYSNFPDGRTNRAPTRILTEQKEEKKLNTENRNYGTGTA